MKMAAVFLAFLGVSIASGFAAVVWDESIDGNFSADPSLPTPISIAVDSNTVMGSIQGPIVPTVSGLDQFTFTVPESASVFSITLDAYGPDDTNISLFNLYAGTLGADMGTLLGMSVLATVNIGSDLLTAPAATMPVTTELGPGDYTIDIREGGAEQNYTLSIVVIPEPSSLVLLGLGTLALLRRRRT